MSATFDPAPVLARLGDLNNAQIADLLGVQPGTVSTWRCGKRRLRLAQADRIACHAIGVHPSALWPEWGSEDWLAARLAERGAA